jgi:rsbT co-antagonist protein RsbR
LPSAGGREADRGAEPARELLNALQQAIRHGNPGVDSGSSLGAGSRGTYGDLPGTNQVGIDPTEVATLVSSLKRPLFQALEKEAGKDAAALATEVWNATLLVDGLGLFTTEVALKAREEV